MTYFVDSDLDSDPTTVSGRMLLPSTYTRLLLGPGLGWGVGDLGVS